MYSNKNAKDFKTPFWTLISGTRYSFISAGKTVNGAHVSATMAIATVVHTLFCLSCTFKLFKSVAKTSCGPIALAMYPNAFTDALRMAFFRAFKSSNNSKQIRIHSFAGTNSAPRSAILPTKSTQFSCTFSCLFFKIGVNLGNKSFTGGVIFDMPTTATMDFKAPKIDPKTSGYSSPKYSYKTTPKWQINCSSSHTFMTGATFEIKSAAC
mmetsp:Transcript_5044/g.16150  ORF Transcript_5044/g.16150 Transcript_5044/m.16150 type:complete len:210 (+) Transcript_5044:523-1152(+)